MNRSFRTAKVLLLALAISGASVPAIADSASDGFAIRAGGDAVTVTNATPGADLLFLGVSLVPDGLYVSTVTTHETVKAENSGTVSFPIPAHAGGQSVWVVVDLAQGEYRVTASIERRSAVTRSLYQLAEQAGAGNDRVTIHANYAEVFVVRPGAGAWFQTASNGGEYDVADDATSISLDVGRFRSLESSSGKVLRLNPRDLVVAFDTYALTAQVSVVAGGQQP